MIDEGTDLEECDLIFFLSGNKVFCTNCLEDLFLICCLIQAEKDKMAVWVDIDDDGNPVSIDVFDDEFNILDSSQFQSEFLDLFWNANWNFTLHEIYESPEEDGKFQYNISFIPENLELNFLNNQFPTLIDGLLSLPSLSSWHENLKLFIVKVLTEYTALKDSH